MYIYIYIYTHTYTYNYTLSGSSKMSRIRGGRRCLRPSGADRAEPRRRRSGKGLGFRV